MNIIKGFFVDIKNFFQKQSKITYALLLTILALISSLLSIVTWILENDFFVARPSYAALWSALAVVLVCIVVWFRSWLLSFHIMYPRGYVKPTKSLDSWVRGNAILVLFATIPNAYFINPYDSHIMAYFFVASAVFNLSAIYLFKKFYIPTEYDQKKWLGRMMIVKALPSFLSRFVPR